MLRKNLPILGLLLALVSASALGQDLRIRKTSEPIVLDGLMDERVWQEADVADRFMQYFPFDSSLAIMETEVRVTYDDVNLYVYAIMYSPAPRGEDEYVTPSLRRDFRGRAFDNFTVMLDTYQDRTNAFNFGVNPFGVEREALIANGGETSSGFRGGNTMDMGWDNKWYSRTKINEDNWVAEIAIPFKTLRYKNDLTEWNVNFYRIDSQDGEMSTWAPIPRNFSIINLAFTKTGQFEEPLQSPGKNISIIPYTAYKAATDFVEGTPTEQQLTAGGDAKIALSSAMNLDLTINPDFSQVEVDQQVTNLDRFEIFFPERRQFFLENADLFASFGSFSARPFFSRRIGIARDTATGNNIQNPLYFGARASGKISNDWRMGLMTIQAAPEDDIGLPSTNYTVGSVQRKVWERSNISMIFVNKQAFQDTIGGEFTPSPANWNRTLGLDFNFASADSKWTGKAYYHRSWDQDDLDSTYSAALEGRYGTYRWNIRAAARTVGANYNPEVGFVRRRDFIQQNSSAIYNIYPAKGKVQRYGIGPDWDIIWNKKYGLMDWDANIQFEVDWRNTATLWSRLRRQYVYLFEPFDPSGSGGVELPADTEYYFNFIILRYSSDERKPFFFRVSTSPGQYYNGHRVNLEGSVTYRFQPYGSISADFEYNRIRLPSPYSDSDLYLVGPRLDLTFTKKLFWTTFFQYNNQIDNFNINSRLQWRYAPVSDLFIVYTDNFFTDINDRFIDFNASKTRAFVIKLTYWLNL